LGVPSTAVPAIQEMALGEKPEQVRARVAEFLDALEDSPYQRIAIVTHGSPIKEMLLHLSREKIDLTKHVYTNGNPAPTCGIWHIRRGDNCRVFTMCFKPASAAYAD
jgi:2,3-bisphosphoglycerate-dependent phosphoglycerate mutase